MCLLKLLFPVLAPTVAPYDILKWPVIFCTKTKVIGKWVASIAILTEYVHSTTSYKEWRPHNRLISDCLLLVLLQRRPPELDDFQMFYCFHYHCYGAPLNCVPILENYFFCPLLRRSEQLHTICQICHWLWDRNGCRCFDHLSRIHLHL